MKLAGAAAKRFLSRPDASVRAALVYGPNRSLVAEAAESIVRGVLGPNPDGFALTRLGEEELRKDRALLGDQLAAQSLLGGDRLLRVRADGDSAAESIVDALAQLEAGAPAAAFLLIEGGDLAAKSKIRSAFDSAAVAVSLPFYDEDASAIAEFARDLLAERNVKLTPDALALFEAALPGDRALVRGEVEKLALYAHGDPAPLAAEIVAALLAVEAESALDDAALAALGGREAEAAEALHRAASPGVSSLRALERRLLRLLEARLMVDRGMPASDAGQKLRPPVFWKERDSFADQLRRWPAQRLQMALDMLWRAQLRAMKAGAPQELIAGEAFRVTARFVRRD